MHICMFIVQLFAPPSTLLASINDLVSMKNVQLMLIKRLRAKKSIDRFFHADHPFFYGDARHKRQEALSVCHSVG